MCRSLEIKGGTAPATNISIAGVRLAGILGKLLKWGMWGLLILTPEILCTRAGLWDWRPMLVNANGSHRGSASRGRNGLLAWRYDARLDGVAEQLDLVMQAELVHHVGPVDFDRAPANR